MLLTEHLIFVNGRFLTQATTGVQRYALEVVKALDKLIAKATIDSERYTLILLAPQALKYEPDLKHIPLRRVGHLSGHLWEQLELPYYARGGLLFSPSNTAPLLQRNQIVTIHDTAFFAYPQNYSFAFRNWYRFLMKRVGRIAKRVIVNSSFAKTELTHYCQIAESKLEVVPVRGTEHILSVDSDGTILQRYNLAHKPFILAVSSMSLTKNFGSVVRAAELLGSTDFDVVVAGGTNPKVFGESNVAWPESIKHVGYVSDEELKTLYENAHCFVFPSLYEGFGLPPLEAMACGCPVIVSRAASLPEVCGEAALYCDPYYPSDLADKIQELMSDAGLRKELRQRGLEHVEQFTWEKCAHKTFAVIERTLPAQG
jgi:glycosyltransferase involved in cell wall biosynthesis